MYPSALPHLPGREDNLAGKQNDIQISLFGWFMIFNATFNNISVKLWPSLLLVEETGVPEKTTGLQQVIDKVYHILK